MKVSQGYTDADGLPREPVAGERRPILVDGPPDDSQEVDAAVTGEADPSFINEDASANRDVGDDTDENEPNSAQAEVLAAIQAAHDADSDIR